MYVERAAFLALTAMLAGAACLESPSSTSTATAPPPPTRPEGDKYERACNGDGQCADLAACVCGDGTQLQMVGCVNGRCMSGWNDCQAMEALTHGCASRGGLSAYGFGAVHPAPSATAASTVLPPVAPPRRPLRDDDPEILSTKAFDPKRKGCGDETPGVGPACESLMAGPCTEGNGPELVRQECSHAAAIYKPGVARRAFTCLARQDRRKNCSYSTVSVCLHAALMDACLDPTAEGACVDLSASCDNVDQAKCMAFLSGVSQDGRKTLVGYLKRHCDHGYMGAIMADDLTKQSLPPLPPLPSASPTAPAPPTPPPRPGQPPGPGF